MLVFFFCSSRRRHTSSLRDWSSDVCSSDLGADCVQFFISDPQDWRIPPPGPRAAEIAATSMTKYVHAPYTINLASGNNRIRIPSRKILADTCRAAEAFGAVAVIVHGGHVTADDDRA